MPFFHKALLAGAAAVFLLGAALLLKAPEAAPVPPLASRSLPQAAAPAADPFPSIELLSAPWYRPSPPPRPAPLPPPPAVPVPPPRVDTTSVSFLGSSRDLGGTPTYFFKFNPTGQVITLRLGETRKGWTLEAITAQKFTLSGAGGRYEVNR
ncbi:MAG TPA: hypothetical protein VMQ10_11730 [Spirochaetia bacterium]|nr:hypothetical protein [Spirochaetia bacterium]